MKNRNTLVLQDKLRLRGWEFKEDLYRDCFEFCARINEKTCEASVIVIAWKYLPEIRETLEILREQGGDYEIVLVNNGGEQSDFEGLLASADVYVKLNRNTGAYLARNMGALFAGGPVYIFLDDDALPGKDYVKNFLKAFAQYRIVAARGKVLPKTDSAFNADAGHYDLGTEPFPRYLDVEGNCAVSAEAFNAVGGWNDSIRFGHGGVELSYRLHKILPEHALQIYWPEAEIFHDYARDQGHLSDKRLRQARSWKMVSCLHPDFCAFLNEWNAFVPVPRFAAKPAEQPEAKQAPETEKPAERGNAPWPPRVEGNKYSGARGRTDGRKVVGFFAKKDDQLNFAVPLMDYLEEQGYAVRPVGTEDIHRHGLEKLMRQVDVAWFEWGEGHVVEASRLRKVCPIICRVHRYEVFSPRMQEVNWKNVDDAVFVNESFVDAFRLVCGIDLRRETRIHGIPNPANEDLPFKERSPGYGIAHVSRFNPDKNPALMLQVLSELVRRDRRYQLHMVGAVQDQQLYMYCMDYVRKAGLEENFHYHGVIGDVPAFLADKSHILSTSIVESQGMGIIEAMLQGLKPVLHRGFAMDRNYPSEYLFGTAGEAADMIASKEFDSHEYRREALRRFSREKVLGEIKLLVDSLAASREKRPAGSVAKTASRKDSLLNLARFYESRGDSKRHEEYMRMAENC